MPDRLRTITELSLTSLAELPEATIPIIHIIPITPVIMLKIIIPTTVAAVYFKNSFMSVPLNYK